MAPHTHTQETDKDKDTNTSGERPREKQEGQSSDKKERRVGEQEGEVMPNDSMQIKAS